MRIAVSSYENIDALCPRCRRIGRFNRVTDLQDTEPVGGRDVICVYRDCRASLRVIGDSVNARHEMLVHDCYALLEEKRYAYCILNLAQAYECFFSLYLRVALCYERQRESLNLDELNRDLNELYDATSAWTFGNLRNAFAALVSEHGARVPVGAIAGCLAGLKSLKIRPISDSQAAANAPWVDLLGALASTTVPSLRNSVVHKSAYRPSRAEVEAALNETRETLFPLASAARIMGEDPNWYIHADERPVNQSADTQPTSPTR